MTSRQSFKSLQAKLQPLQVQPVTDELYIQQQDGLPWDTRTAAVRLQGPTLSLGEMEIISVLQQDAVSSELTSNHSMHVRSQRGGYLYAGCFYYLFLCLKYSRDPNLQQCRSWLHLQMRVDGLKKSQREYWQNVPDNLKGWITCKWGKKRFLLMYFHLIFCFTNVFYVRIWSTFPLVAGRLNNQKMTWLCLNCTKTPQMWLSCGGEETLASTTRLLVLVIVTPLCGSPPWRGAQRKGKDLLSTASQSDTEDSRKH